MGYLTKEVLQKEFKNMINVIATIGIALSGVIALIGILNFINAILTQIISRKREFAMLQSIGMTNDQLLKTLVCELYRDLRRHQPSSGKPVFLADAAGLE